MILSLIAGLALFVIMGTGCTNEISADSLEDNGSGHVLILERIAERFDLDIDEVADFIEELKEERRASMEERFEERLGRLVEDGKITSEQKEAILEKKEELEIFREKLEDMKVSQAREAIKEMKEELKDWTEENDLELKHFFPENGQKRFKPGGSRNFGPDLNGRI